MGGRSHLRGDVARLAAPGSDDCNLHPFVSNAPGAALRRDHRIWHDAAGPYRLTWTATASYPAEPTNARACVSLCLHLPVLHAPATPAARTSRGAGDRAGGSAGAASGAC